MLHQPIGDALPHGVEDKIDTFSPSHLGRRDKVCVSSDENNLVDLLFE